MTNFYSMDYTANILITLIGYNFEIDEYGDNYYIDGFALDDETIERFSKWLNLNTEHIEESYDTDTWYTKEYKTLIIDWYGEDI